LFASERKRKLYWPIIRRDEVLRSFYFILALFALVTSALADECDARAADLVRETGATFDRRSFLKIFLKLGDLGNLRSNAPLRWGWTSA